MELSPQLLILERREFNRIRVGINRPSNGMAIVLIMSLAAFLKKNKSMIKEAVEKSADACEEWMKKPFLQVMNIYNQ